MKKLMTMLSAVAVAIGLQAADTGTSFEGLTAGELDITSTTGELSGGPGFWAQSGSVTGTYTVVDGTSVPRQNLAKTPNQFDEQDQLKYLNIQTTFGNALTRNVKDTGAGQTIGTDGFYFDSLVKFTAFDQDPTELQALDFSGAKIAVWLQETNPDAEGNTTNLYIYAGTVGGDPQPYNCGPLTDAGDWHRLTIKAIANIYSTGDRAGFVVFIDGQVKGATTYNTGIVEANLSDKYTGFYGARALFPSIDTTQYASVISSVAFDGQGDVDDIVFTATVPADIPSAKDAEYVTVTWTAADIASIAIDGVAQTVADGSAKITYQGAGSATITVTYVEGKTGDNSITFNYTDAGDSYTVVASAAGASFNGTSYTTLAAAVTEANAAGAAGTLKLFNASAEDTIGINNANAIITIDLNGQTVGAIEASTTVIVTDTLGGGKVEGYSSFGEGSQILAGAFNASENSASDLNPFAPQGYEFRDDDNDGYLTLAEKAVIPVVAENPWYNNPKAVVLAENLPGQTGNIVSAFHGQGEGEYLGLTYSTNPQQFDLFQVDGTNAVTTLRSIAAADATNPGFRGVAISKKLGIAMTLAYATTTTMYAYPLAGGEATAVVKPSTYSFDAGAFSPDGAYFFSNALNGEGSNQYYVKWSVAVANDGVVTLSKVGSISAGGRGRSLAYARINGRDLVFGLVDTGKVVVMDMTDADSTNWTAADLITGLPAHSYGTLCVSGVNVVDALGNAATPHLTVATSTNNGATKIDVLNVYALTVPASGAVSQTSVKSFDEDALTAAGFGDISDANRYGNTVYVTDDEATIYFARPDNKLYAAQFAYAVDFVADGVTTSVSVFPGDAVAAPADPTKENYIFDGWFNNGVAYDFTAPVTGDLTLTAQFTAAEAKVGTTLYATLKAAVEAAAADATVTVLKDCTVADPIVFSAGITVSNDYTVTLNANYALRFANGNTPVTICGSGSFVGNGAGSPLLVGSNEVKSNYGIESTYSASLVLNGCTFSAKAGQGNVVKLENGTLTVNDATITTTATNVRGVKADADVGNFTSTLIVNGGTISCAKASVAVSADTGTASATINGGNITAPLSCGGAAGTATLTIPGTSTAKFSAQPAAAYVESGYETVKSGDWYVVQAVYVPTYIDAITLNTNALDLVVGDTATLTATYVETVDDSVTWASSDSAIATVANGVVTAVSNGTVTVTVAAVTGSGSATCTVKVSAAAPAVQPIVPAEGGSTEYSSEGAAIDARDAINKNPSAYITAPAGVTDTAAYYSKVEAKVVPGTDGKYCVVLEVAEAAKPAVKAAAETSAAAVVNGKASAVTVSEGLYYKVTTDTSVAFDSAEGKGKTTTSGLSSGSVPVTKPGLTQGFIKVEVDAKPIQ